MAKPVHLIWDVEMQEVENGSLYTQYRARLEFINGDTWQTAMVAPGMTEHTFDAVPAGQYTAHIELSDDEELQTLPVLQSMPFEVIDDAEIEMPINLRVIVGDLNG